MKTTFKKGNLYINKNSRLVVKCTRDSIQGSYNFEGTVTDQGLDYIPVGHHDSFWNARVFSLYYEDTKQEPELNIIL